MSHLGKLFKSRTFSKVEGRDGGQLRFGDIPDDWRRRWHPEINSPVFTTLTV